MTEPLAQQPHRRSDNVPVDPTDNVMALVSALEKSHAELRAADNKYYDLAVDGVKEVATLRTQNDDRVGLLRVEYQEKLAKAEAGRLDSIRQVDREEVAKTAVVANTAITTLAKQTSDLQQTLAKQVTDTAAAQETRNSAQYSDVNKRLSALELTSSEGKGKQSVADPQLVQSMNDIRELLVAQNKGSGRVEGISTSWGVIIAAAAIAMSLYFGLRANTTITAAPPQVIYMQPQAK